MRQYNAWDIMGISADPLHRKPIPFEDYPQMQFGPPPTRNTADYRLTDDPRNFLFWLRGESDGVAPMRYLDSHRRIPIGNIPWPMPEDSDTAARIKEDVSRRILGAHAGWNGERDARTRAAFDGDWIRSEMNRVGGGVNPEYVQRGALAMNSSPIRANLISSNAQQSGPPQAPPGWMPSQLAPNPTMYGSLQSEQPMGAPQVMAENRIPVDPRSLNAEFDRMDQPDFWPAGLPRPERENPYAPGMQIMNREQPSDWEMNKARAALWLANLVNRMRYGQR